MNIAWKAAPDMDSDAPTKSAAMMRGRRILRRMFSRSCLSTDRFTPALNIFQRKNPQTSSMLTGYFPSTSEMSTAMTRAQASPIM
ncbi:MAG TPA: hypothetical protein PKJ17_00675, partial [Syntrophorhabdaceae bacterium]|nr:hypothetical protein [Syntrophorhabdaceae bacterium]